ncbi:hypothetical protein LTS18_001011, partial [Coniosporium uncinatum]
MINAAFSALKRLAHPEDIDNADKKQASARLKLTVGTHPASHILAQATNHLIAGRPSRAHEIYTEILASSSPGHPCAFLNRSLCYLLLDYPSLAVTDAYRALLAANCGKYEGVGNPYAKALIGFAQTVREAQEAGQGWASDNTCLVGKKDGLLGVELASVRICPRSKRKVLAERSSQPSPSKKSTNTFTKAAEYVSGLADETRMKAYYRLAFALWKCGGGALKSALN